jgi:hypothetical protein
MRHDGRTDDALCSTVGAAAKPTVSDSNWPPRFTKWKSYDREETSAVPPPMRPDDQAATQWPRACAYPGANRMTLTWQRVYGDRGLQWAECSIGTFRTRTVGRRVILSLNDVKIGNHGDAARARAQAERLIEAVAEQMGRRRAGEHVEPTHAKEPAA